MTSYSKKINKLFFFWLLTSLGLIFSMVLIGGLTRLTDSGLSITEWELFKGILPPLNQTQWNEYFSYYKQIPQYKLLNNNMTIDQFKIIFYWEYFHRILGRVIGLFFLLPLIFFYFNKEIDKRYIKISLFVLFLIIIQGLIGWYMVQSGLTINTSVSHYRLSLHLILAFIISSIIFWMILNLKSKFYKRFFYSNVKNYFFYFLILLFFFQIILGAFVSGLDAGKIYQTWPLMNLNYFPNDIMITKFLDLFDFDNHSLVQFYHRNMAYLIFLLICGTGIYIFIKKEVKLYRAYYILIFFLIVQIFLGIMTLISGLNIYAASLHQICSLFLVLSIINLYYNYIN